MEVHWSICKGFYSVSNILEFISPIFIFIYFVADPASWDRADGTMWFQIHLPGSASSARVWGVTAALCYTAAIRTRCHTEQERGSDVDQIWILPSWLYFVVGTLDVCINTQITIIQERKKQLLYKCCYLGGCCWQPLTWPLPGIHAWWDPLPWVGAYWLGSNEQNLLKILAHPVWACYKRVQQPSWVPYFLFFLNPCS